MQSHRPEFPLAALRRPFLPGLALALSLLLGACGDSAPPPAAASAVPDKTVTITANDDMKFDVTKIEAKPGQKITLTLKDVGTAPKFSMGHNWTLLNRGTDVNKFIEAGAEHPNNAYIAPTMKGNVIASTKLLGPGESDTITFRAPTLPGDFDFVCTFPGHAAVGMKGKLVVAP